MTKQAELSQEQRVVAAAMVSALVTALIVLGIVALANPSLVAAPFVVRLQSALRLDLSVIAWLVATIANVARLRFFSARDIDGGAAQTGSQKVQQAGAILQNTLEQVGLAVVTHLIVAATFNGSTALITALVCLFSIGRLLFWVGYKHGAKGRAFGFALTFYPSIIALIAATIVPVFR